MTTLSEAKIAINDKFIAEWADRTPYTFDNEEFTEPDGAWVRVTVRNLGGGQETLGKAGNRKYERTGLILINVYTPVEEGTSKNDILSMAARDIFEGTRLGEIVVNNATIRELGADKTWYQEIMEAEFTYHEIK